MDTSTRQHDRTFTLLSSPTFPILSGSFNAFFLLDFKFGWRGAQVGFSVSILWAEVTIRRKRRRWASYFLASGPWIHPTNDTRRYGAKEAYPRLGSLAARQTFFQAVDRLPHPRVRWLASLVV